MTVTQPRQTLVAAENQTGRDERLPRVSQTRAQSSAAGHPHRGRLIAGGVEQAGDPEAELGNKSVRQIERQLVPALAGASRGTSAG